MKFSPDGATDRKNTAPDNSSVPTDGIEADRSGVLASSSIDNASASSSSVVVDGVSRDDDAACGHGVAALTGPDMTGAGEADTSSTFSPRKKPHTKRGRRGGRSGAQRAHVSKI